MKAITQHMTSFLAAQERYIGRRRELQSKVDLGVRPTKASSRKPLIYRGKLASRTPQPEKVNYRPTNLHPHGALGAAIAKPVDRIAGKPFIAAAVLLFVLSAGCCHCRDLAGNCQAKSAPILNPMMQDVARWLNQRQFSFITNEVGGKTTFLAGFADQPGSQPSYACSIGTSPEKNVLILDAVFSPAIPAGTEVVAFVWLTAANSNSQWGFYGFDAQQSQLWFRISHFRPDQRVKPGEMDELLDKTSTALRAASDLLMAEPAGEESPTPENQIKPVRENWHPTLVLTSSKTGTPRLAARCNSTKQMNYLQVSPDQR